MTSQVTIRQAKAQDARILALSEAKLAQTPGLLASRPEELKSAGFLDKIESLSNKKLGYYVVAVKDKHIIGHALLKRMSLKATSHIVKLTIAVHPGHEENGVGTLLLSHLKEWAQGESSIEKIELNVRATNKRALSLYQKFGFAEEGRIKGRIKLADGTYIDDIMMALWVD